MLLSPDYVLLIRHFPSFSLRPLNFAENENIQLEKEETAAAQRGPNHRNRSVRLFYSIQVGTGGNPPTGFCLGVLKQFVMYL